MVLYEDNKFLKNEIASIVIGVVFSFLLIFFFGSEVLEIWKPASPNFIEISFIAMLVLKCFSFIGWYLALEEEGIELQFKNVLYFGYALTIAINICILDFEVYPKHSIAVLYALLVPFGWFLTSKNGSYIAAFSAILLSLVMYFFVADGTSFGIFITNRISSLIVIFMLGVFLNYFKKIKVKLRETNKILNRKIIETELKSKELEQFVYTVSHDLKEPLRSLSVILDIFREGNKDLLNEEDSELLALVKKSTLKMGGSIQSMLDYSKLGQNFKLEYLAINKVMNDVLFELDDLIKSVDVEFDIKDLGVLNVYLIDFKLLFSHLIDNAIKYRTKNELCKISITRKDTETYAVFYIKDNGIGIEKVNHERIFKIFQSLDANEDKRGIGLAHCSKIVELHKGNISVESKLGKGSTFVVEIHKNLR